MMLPRLLLALEKEEGKLFPPLYQDMMNESRCSVVIWRKGGGGGGGGGGGETGPLLVFGGCFWEEEEMERERGKSVVVQSARFDSERAKNYDTGPFLEKPCNIVRMVTANR